MQKEKQDTNEGRGGGVSMCIKILLIWLDNHLTWSLRAKFYPWPPKKTIEHCYILEMQLPDVLLL